MNKRGSYFLLWFTVLVPVTLLWVSGCGGSSKPKTIPITGRVTIDGQPPGEEGSLYFTPTESAPGYIKRPASGGYTADGSYHVMSWEPNDGLVPGHYSVSVSPNDPKVTKVPVSYQASGTSGLEVDVPIDQGKIEYNIELSTK